MSSMTLIYESLCEKLNRLGYNQSFPISALPLVNEMLTDFIQTTESLREIKKNLKVLNEEKNCWELGIEPYKCDNSRLLKELNQQCAENLEVIENYEMKLHDLHIKLGYLQTENSSLLVEIREMKNQVKKVPKQTSSTFLKVSSKQKLTSITAARQAGNTLASSSNTSNAISDTKSARNHLEEIKKLGNANKELSSQIETLKKLMDSRDKEIKRLTDLLVGGRSPVALARDCCYTEVASMSQDINRLQAEKSELIEMLHQYENKMQEAMQRSIDLSKLNTNLRKEMDTLKSVALEVEHAANLELAEQENEITKLNGEIENLSTKCGQLEEDLNLGGRGDATESLAFKNLSDRYNEVSRIAIEQKRENQRLVSKIKRQKELLEKLAKDVKHVQCNAVNCEGEKCRKKSEKERIYKEFLRNVADISAQDEMKFLQKHIGKKDKELRKLKTQVEAIKSDDQITENWDFSPKNSGKNLISSRSCDAVYFSLSESGWARKQFLQKDDYMETTILNVDEKNDCIQEEASKSSCKQDKVEDLENLNLEKEDVTEKVKEVELQHEEALGKSDPNESENHKLKEEVEEYKSQLEQIKAENTNLNCQYNQLKAIQEEAQQTLTEVQNRLIAAERQLVIAEDTISTLNSLKDSEKNESSKLAVEIDKLTETYISMEQEKDKLLDQLDAKSEIVHFLETELKLSEDQKRSFEHQIRELEGMLSSVKKEKVEVDLELKEVSSEINSLRQEILFLKESQHRIFDENVRLSKELTESNSERLVLSDNLNDVKSENVDLKKELRHSMQEIKAAKDFLLEKEKDWSIALEDKNRTHGFKIGEMIQVIKELESEMNILRKDLESRSASVRELEGKIFNKDSRISSLVRYLNEATEDQNLLRKNLCFQRNLCNQLEEEKENLKASLNEFTAKRKQLEMENETLRKDFENIGNDYKSASIELELVLKETKNDLKKQLQIDTKLNEELLLLKQEKEELMKQLAYN